MNLIFLKILNISFTTCWLILAVIVLRLIFCKAPKWVSCLLWALVFIRLVLPFSFESSFSMIPSSEIISADIITGDSLPSIDSGIAIINDTVNPIMAKAFVPDENNGSDLIHTVLTVSTVVWITGTILMIIYAFISYMLLKKSIGATMLFEGNKRIKVSDGIKTPFILGIFRPVIYIPSSLDKETCDYILEHEKAHIKRGDHFWKPFGFVLLSIHWFNPLCWIAYDLLCKDIEAACDEKVIRNKDHGYMAAYSQVLLNCAVQRRRISACPLSFGETGVRQRVKGILNYKKPAFWIVLISVSVIVAAGVCFLTIPKKNKEKDVIPSEEYFSTKFSYEVSGDVNADKITVTGESTGNEESGSIYFRTEAPKLVFVDGDIPSDFTFTGAVGVEHPVIVFSGANGEFENFTVWPTTSERISVSYEPETHPETDIAGELGDPIYAITDGTIVYVGWDEVKGNEIILSSKDALIEYHHLDSISVQSGDEVKGGQKIGELGNTGLSTGPHLGISLLKDLEKQDITLYYKTN